MEPMIEVDLLPGGKKARGKDPAIAPPLRRVRGVPVDGWILGCGLTMVISVGFVAHLFLSSLGRTSGFEEALEAARGDSVENSVLIRKMQTLEARRDSIAARVAIIQEIDAQRYLWPRIMDEVASALPAEAWLTQLADMPSEAGRIRFRVEGSTRDNFALTRFWNRLESSLFIRNVRLISTEHIVAPAIAGGNRAQDLYAFVLEADQEDPPPGVVVLVPLGGPGAP